MKHPLFALGVLAALNSATALADSSLHLSTPHPHIVERFTVNLDPNQPGRTRPWTRTVTVDTENSPLFSTDPKPGFLQAAGAIPHAGLGDHEVNLTFDDGPQPRRTENVLKILASAGLRVNFFMMGKNAFYYKNIAAKVAAAGHVIGSHSVTHPIMRDPTPEFARDQIECGSYLVAKSTGMHVPFFRFPGGEITRVSYEALQDAGLAAFFWDVDSTDCHVESSADIVYSQVMKQLEARPSGIILMHDVWGHTATALPYILETLYRNNFTIVTFEPRNQVAATPDDEVPPFCKKTLQNLEEGKQWEHAHFGPDDPN